MLIGSAVLREGATAEDQDKFEAEQQKAFSTILLSVSSSLLYLISSCELPENACDTLKKHFERESLAHKLFLKKQKRDGRRYSYINTRLKEMKMLADCLIGADHHSGVETATEKWGEVLTDHSSNFDTIIIIFHLLITM